MSAQTRAYLSLSTVSGGGLYVVNGKLCVAESLGMVFSHRTQGIAWYHDLFARVRDFVGGGVKSYDKPIHQALILPCLRELSDQACELYEEPHAILGVSFAVRSVGVKGMSMMSATAQGTAVRWVPIETLPLPIQAAQPLAVMPIDRVGA